MFARAALLLVVAAAPSAGAVSYTVTATTLLRARQDLRAGELYTTAPLYELLTLTSSPADTKWLDDARMVLSVWGDADVGDPRDGRHFDGDIDLAYGEGALLEGKLRLRFGRQLVLGGAARNLQLDGLSLSTEHSTGLGATVYAGAPVTRRFEVDRGDAAAGARVHFRPTFSTELGASAIHVLDDGRVARQDLGLDGRYAITPEVLLSAFGLMNAAEGRLAEADAQLVWLPSHELDLVLEARHTAPDLFLPRNSIFTVFSEETRNELGGRARYAVLPSVDLSAGYFFLAAPAGDGYRVDAEARWSAPLGRTMVGLEGNRLLVPSSQAEQDGYWQARLFGRRQLVDALAVAGEAELYDFDLETERSLLGSASVVYQLGGSWHAVLTGRGGTTPLYERYFEGMLKIAYNATYSEVIAGDTTEASGSAP